MPDYKHSINRNYPVYHIFPCLLAMMLLLFSNQSSAWHIEMHAKLAEIAHAALPAHIREPLAPYLPELMQGAMEPDLYLLDLADHFLNIHEAAEDRLAQSRIEQLYYEIQQQLTQPYADHSEIAFQMGRLAHYLADINQPLHTDELAGEALMHLQYEDDVWQNMIQISLFDPGIRFRLNPSQEALASAIQANQFYSELLSAYRNGQGLDDVLELTQVNVQRAAEDIRDTWTTLWQQAKADKPQIALSSNHKYFVPGDFIRFSLSSLINKQVRNRQADLCLAVITESGAISFLNSESEFIPETVCYRYNMTLSSQNMELFTLQLPSQFSLGEYYLYAVFITPGSNLMEQSNWLSNLAELMVFIKAIPKSDKE